jgi:hypothetical protein
VFESGRAPLVRAWDSRDFIRSPGPIKYAFREEVRFSHIQKKNIYVYKRNRKCVFIFPPRGREKNKISMQ